MLADVDLKMIDRSLFACAVPLMAATLKPRELLGRVAYLQ